MIHSLTGLRFYAALIVFLSHLHLFNYFSELTDGLAFKFWKESGWAGVSLFFVLSGFVLFINYCKPETNGKLDIKRFYLARLARIYPVFLLTTLLAAPLQWLSPEHKPFWYPFFLNLGLIHCFDSYACSSFNAVGWSLSLEAFFYGLFPIFTLIFTNKPFRNVSLLFIAYLAYLTVLQVFIPTWYLAHGNFPLNRIGEFVSGMAAGYWYQCYSEHSRLNDWINRKGMGFLAVLLIALLIVMMSLRPLLFHSYPTLDQVGYLYYIIPAVVIVLSLACLEKAGSAPRLFTHPLVILAGEISYSFYLIHHLVMRYSLHIGRLVSGVNLKQLDFTSGLPFALIQFAISLGLAYGLYQLIEKPCRQKIMSLWGLKQSPSTDISQTRNCLSSLKRILRTSL